jgi:hypothetical protein
MNEARPWRHVDSTAGYMHALPVAGRRVRESFDMMQKRLRVYEYVVGWSSGMQERKEG